MNVSVEILDGDDQPHRLGHFAVEAIANEHTAVVGMYAEPSAHERHSLGVGGDECAVFITCLEIHHLMLLSFYTRNASVLLGGGPQKRVGE